MDLKIRNLKGTKDFLPEEQQIRNKIRFTLEEIFRNYGYKPLETPILCYYNVLASKYAGGAEILKEMYKLQDQGKRKLALRYDLTVPFAKVIGMNPYIRMPFKRYEIGKVFRNGPVKTGRVREFIQCDVDVVGVKSMMAEAELILMAFNAFEKLDLNVYISYSNRKLLTGLLCELEVEKDQINQVILTLDKLDKIGPEKVKDELYSEDIKEATIENIFKIYFDERSRSLSYFERNFTNSLLLEGIKELKELSMFLSEIGVAQKVIFNPFLARGLEIYTGTIYEVFFSDGSITSSIASGGRYDKIIGAFLNDGKEYPAVGISFGLDVIYTAYCLKQKENYRPFTDIFIIPIGTENSSLKIANELRQKGWAVDIEMCGKRLKKALDYANKEKIPYVLILGEEELKSKVVKLKCMRTGKEIDILIQNIADEIARIDNK